MKRISLLLFLSIFMWAGCEKDEFTASERTDESGDKFYATGSAGGSFGGSAGGAVVGSGSGQAGDSTLQAGQLTAGEWNDLDNWAFWQELIVKDTFQNYLSDWGFYDFNRISVALQYADGKPVIDAVVILRNQAGEQLWKTRTDNKGRAECFPWLQGASSTGELRLTAQYNGQSYGFGPVEAYPYGINTLTLPGGLNTPTQADVVFVFDATGSMGDELEYVKVEFEDIISRIQAENAAVGFRLGATFYRDEGDEYVTQHQPLTTSFSQVGNFIKVQQANGGGDYPEAVHSALQEAISNQQWSSPARARLVFLVLDAPPHKQQPVITAIHDELTAAALNGIKIIPISASGVNKETEFLLRAMAAATNGTYTFITDHSGIGNDHLEPTIGDYEVEYLNDLIVRLIGAYVE